MTNFEKLTASPEALAALLASIPAAATPWDDAFHRQYCHSCGLEDCDHCPHEAERNNPAWWLIQTAEATPSDKSVAPRSRFKGLYEMTDEEINAFAGCFYRVIQSIREAKQQQQQNSQT